MADALDKLYAYERRRMRDMPAMIAAAERKLAGLYREAKRYRMDDLLKDKSFADDAWDFEIKREQIRCAATGAPSSLGEAD